MVTIWLLNEYFKLNYLKFATFNRTAFFQWNNNKIILLYQPNDR